MILSCSFRQKLADNVKPTFYLKILFIYNNPHAVMYILGSKIYFFDEVLKIDPQVLYVMPLISPY